MPANIKNNRKMKQIAKNWLAQAESDLDSAKYNFQGKKLDVAAYLCQQSVEKGLKALYLNAHKKLWKTHDLIKLASLVNAPKEIVQMCNELNPIYVEDRYPDFSDIIPAKKFNEDEIKDFLEKAEKTLKWIKAH